MSFENAVNWAFAWLLAGSTLWALIYRPIDRATRAKVIAASACTILAWPVMMAVIVVNYRARMKRRAR